MRISLLITINLNTEEAMIDTNVAAIALSLEIHASQWWNNSEHRYSDYILYVIAQLVITLIYAKIYRDDRCIM